MLIAYVTLNRHFSCTCVSYWTNTCEGGYTSLDLMETECVRAQYLRGESGNENNFSLIRTRSLCCPGRAWHLQPFLGSTLSLYSRAGSWSYAAPYNWFASVPKSTHKAMPDFTRFLFKEKRRHRQEETVVVYHLQFLTRMFREEKVRSSMCSKSLSLCCLLDSCPKKVKCWLTLNQALVLWMT